MSIIIIYGTEAILTLQIMEIPCLIYSLQYCRVMTPQYHVQRKSRLPCLIYGTDNNSIYVHIIHVLWITLEKCHKLALTVKANKATKKHGRKVLPTREILKV
jgi:hypothetical protein